MSLRPLIACCVVGLAGCRAAGPPSGVGASKVANHSSSIAVSPDGAELFVANADADSVSVIDLASRSLKQEILLAPAHPAVAVDGSFTPAVMPRALALSADARTLFVSGERSGTLMAVDLSNGSVRGSVAVGSEPVGVLAAADGKSVFVACSQEGTVVKVDAAKMQVVATAQVPAKPWALAWANDGALLITHLLGPGVTAIEPAAMKVRATWTVPDGPPRGDKRIAHGQVRGLFDLVARPGTDELWVAHEMLGTDTPQPELDFESTAFPTLSVLRGEGSFVKRLSTDAQDVPGDDGAFADIVSGPHALAFAPDGRYALVLDAHSEDLMAIDAERDVEVALLRPLPGHDPEGLALSPDGQYAYVEERNTSDVAVVRITRDDGGLSLALDGPAIPRLESDPMPSELRLGQQLFYSADSDAFPITTNHWIACATCHMEGRSDAVTWKFAQGPRDTPTNAGGMLGTGFLFRTADRNRVQDYWHTINVEQGGHFFPDDPALAPLLDAIAAYVNRGIPLPVPPHTDAQKVERGRALFNRQDVGCATCHGGPRFTDSGAGNPSLDLGGAVKLHDVGTCVTAGYPDVAHEDVAGHPRAACMFDTPSLNGIADSAPYLHDGSAATLRDVLEMTRGKMGDISSLSSDDEDALVEYLRSL